MIWSTRRQSLYGRYRLHHAAVSAVAVSANEKFVVSAGGKDDNTYIVWNISEAAPMCGRTITEIDRVHKYSTILADWLLLMVLGAFARLIFGPASIILSITFSSYDYKILVYKMLVD